MWKTDYHTWMNQQSDQNGKYRFSRIFSRDFDPKLYDQNNMWYTFVSQYTTFWKNFINENTYTEYIYYKIIINKMAIYRFSFFKLNCHCF
jgi:hypothetical protein